MADEDTFFTTFAKYDEFSALQAKFLTMDLFVEPTPDEEREERLQLKKLCLVVRRHRHVVRA